MAGVMMIDFSTAFDLVDHSLLLQKLELLGFDHHAKMIDHTIHIITDAALSGERARSSDEFGAVTVLQMAMDQSKDIILFLYSGTGLYMDMSSGYSYRIQRALDLINCNRLGGTNESSFRRIIFPAPTTPFVSLPNSKSPLSE